MTILSADSSSTQAMYNDDNLVLLPGVRLYVDYDAITGNGEDTLNISGSVYAHKDAFRDNSGGGLDTIVLTSSSSVISDSMAFYSGGGYNELNNSGYVYGYWAMWFAAGHNFLRNSGEISSRGTTIEFDGGYSTIDNTGNITNIGAPSSPTEAIFMSGDNNNISNSGTIHGYGEAIWLDGSSNFIDNEGEISSQSTGIELEGAAASTINNSGKISGGSMGVYSTDGGADSIANSGTISGNGVAIKLTGPGSVITNSGTISGNGSAINLAGAGSFINNLGVVQSTGWTIYLTGANAQLDNSGSISGNTHALRIDSGSAVVNNSGTISSAGTGVFFGGSNESFANSGSVSGNSNGVFVAGSNSTVTNTGTILSSGYAASFSGDDDTFINSGRAVGNIRFIGNNSVYDGALGSVSGYIYLGVGANDMTGGAGSEKFLATVGSFTIAAGAGDDVVYAYANFNASQQYDGGAGTDTLQLWGDYSAGLVFSDTTMTNVERLVLGVGGDYKLTMNDATVASGQRLAVNGLALTADDVLTLDASDETDGYYTVHGGLAADTFIFDAAHFSKFDVIAGGSGSAVDTLSFSTAATLSASALSSVTGVEKILLANATNTVVLSDAMVGSANNGLVTVNGGAGADTIDANAVSAAHHVQFVGGAGADTMTGGAGLDYFYYAAASDSTGPNYDTISRLNFSSDKINLPGTNPISGIDATVTTGALSATTFDADLASDLTGKLGAHHAVLFTSSSGTLSGQTFLVADLNGTAGYQAGGDVVIHLTGQTGTLTAGSFI